MDLPSCFRNSQLRDQVVVVGGDEVEGGEPACQAGAVLEAAVGRPDKEIKAGYNKKECRRGKMGSVPVVGSTGQLGDLNVPHPVGGSPGEHSEVDRGRVPGGSADVHID